MPKVEGYEESCERYVAVSLMAPLRLSAPPGYRFGLKSRVGQWQVARHLENFVTDVSECGVWWDRLKWADLRPR